MPVEPKAKPNTKYYYSDDDIAPLSSKYKKAKNYQKIKWAAPTSIDTINLLKDSFQNLEQGDQLLVPINKDNHWFGAIFELNKIEGLGFGYKVTWLDSLKKQDPQNEQRDEILKTFVEKLNTPISIKEQNTLTVTQQGDQSSCGPWVIENLKYASDYNSYSDADAKKRVQAEYNTLNENNIRSSHIEILGDEFAKKQTQNNRLDTNIDQSKFNAFKGDVDTTVESMKVLAQLISTTATSEYKDALSTFAEASSWGQTPENQAIKNSALDQIKKIASGNSFTAQIEANKDKKGYLTNLNEYVKYFGPRDELNTPMATPKSDEQINPIVSTPVFKGAKEDDKINMIFLARGINAAPNEYKEGLSALAAVSPALSPNDIQVAWNQIEKNFPNQSYLNNKIKNKIHEEGYLDSINKFLNSPELSAENTRSSSKLSTNKSVETKTIDDIHFDLAKEIHTHASTQLEQELSKILKSEFNYFDPEKKFSNERDQKIWNNINKNLEKIDFPTLNVYAEAFKAEDIKNAQEIDDTHFDLAKEIHQKASPELKKELVKFRKDPFHYFDPNKSFTNPNDTKLWNHINEKLDKLNFQNLSVIVEGYKAQQQAEKIVITSKNQISNQVNRPPYVLSQTSKNRTQ